VGVPFPPRWPQTSLPRMVTHGCDFFFCSPPLVRRMILRPSPPPPVNYCLQLRFLFIQTYELRKIISFISPVHCTSRKNVFLSPFPSRDFDSPPFIFPRVCASLTPPSSSSKHSTRQSPNSSPRLPCVVSNQRITFFLSPCARPLRTSPFFPLLPSCNF